MVALASMVWAISGQTNKLDQLLLTTAKLEKRVDDRDGRLDIVKEVQYDMRRVQDAHNMRLEALERAAHK